MTINGVTGDVIFRNNRADAGDKASDYNGNFGAIYSGQDMDIFNVQGDLRFEGNHASNSARSIPRQRKLQPRQCRLHHLHRQPRGKELCRWHD